MQTSYYTQLYCSMWQSYGHILTVFDNSSPPKLPMPNFFKHVTTHPTINISVGRRHRNTQGFCNLQIGLSGKCNIFKQGGEELLLSGRREVPGWVSSTWGKVLKILPVWTIRVLQMVRAVGKSSSVQVSLVGISPVSKMRRAERMRMILKAESPRRRTDAIKYSPWVFIWEVWMVEK